MTTVELTDFGKDIYGAEEATVDSWHAYGYALMAIAGADEDLSDRELGWMMRHFRKAGTPDDVLQSWADYDYRNADLDKLIGQIRFGEPRHHVRILLYDAIQMTRQDRITGAEMAAIDRAAELLRIDSVTANMILSLVELERTAASMRRALFTSD